jgi:lipopolysaccharide biosynthesis protein
MSSIPALWQRYRSVRSPLRHGASKFAEIVGGSLFLSAPGQAVWRAMASKQDPAVDGMAKAVVAHVYYLDLLDEVLECWGQLPIDSHLHITTSASLELPLRNRFQHDKRVHVHVYENRGRDIAPFLMLLGSGQLDRYQAVLKIHAKRSPHLLTGTLRRRLLLTILAGDAMRVRHILALFNDPTVGIAGWRAAHRHSERHWGENRANVAALAHRLQPTAHEPPTLSFFEGSMFWCRPKALQSLRSIGLTSSDFPAEPSRTDGELQHAVERIFNHAARTDGFRVVSLSGRSLDPSEHQR